MSISSLKGELERLVEELDATGAGKSPRAEDTPADDALPHIEALNELASYLTGKAGEAEDLLVEHPLIAVAAAFTLGLAVGRLTSR